eukprot:TRINITY_DN3839_c0_g1_i1.p1 TRINITY_DN3839_c0_g1~~TRINITY_DN3839_c0_g1_i1.p1  ORF type:complete len:401 (+),score=147.58 TRINITY_DN3839_c0_g1_i1:147-1349(+)
MADKRSSNKKGAESPVQATDSPATVLRKQSMLGRAKKNVTGKVATSAVGKKLLAEVLPAAFKVLDFVKGMVTVLDGREKAKLVKRNLLKGSVKTAMLYQSKALSLETLNEIKLPVLQVWITYVEYCEAPETADIGKLSQMISAIFPRLRTELTGHVSPENLALFGDTFDYLGSASFLRRVFCIDPLTELARVTSPATAPSPVRGSKGKPDKPQSKSEAKKEAQREAKRVIQEAKKAEKLKMQQQKRERLQKKKEEAAAKKSPAGPVAPQPTQKLGPKAKKPKKGVELTIEERTERVIELRGKSGEYLREYWETEITQQEKEMVRKSYEDEEKKKKKKKKKKKTDKQQEGAEGVGAEKKKKKDKQQQQQEGADVVGAEKKKKKKKSKPETTTTTTTTTTTH